MLIACRGLVAAALLLCDQTSHEVDAVAAAQRDRFRTRLSCEYLPAWARYCQNACNGPTFLSRSTRREPPSRECQRPGRGRPCASPILISQR